MRNPSQPIATEAFRTATLPLSVRIDREPGMGGVGTVSVQEDSGETWRQMEGDLGPVDQVSADNGHWLLDTTKGVLRRLDARDGRSARFAIYGCKPR